MCIEYSIRYERNNIIEEKIIELADCLNIQVDEVFLEREIFFNHSGNYLEEDYGKGKIIVLKNKASNEFLVFNTFLKPSDQTQGMNIAIKFNEKRDKEQVKALLMSCFEEDSSCPLIDGFFDLPKSTLNILLNQNRVTEDVFYGTQEYKAKINVELINFM